MQAASEKVMKTLTDATAVGGEKQKMVLNSP